MSSATNHKARSRRGSLKKKGFLATKRSPLIRAEKKAQNKLFREFFNGLFKRSPDRKDVE